MAKELKRNSDFDAYRVNFKGFGFSGTATAGQVTNIDYQIAETRLVYGGQLILSSHVHGDKASFQVVDKDNILGYGAGAILGEYIKDWNMAADVSGQYPLLIDYPTEIMTGLYFRIKYTSTGGADVSVGINVYCVKNIT